MPPAVSRGGSRGVGGLVGFNDATITSSFYATTDANGNAINNGGAATGAFTGNTFGTGKTWRELSQLSTFTDAGWDIDDAGGTGKVWRIYQGHAGPLLRSFLTAVTVTANPLSGKTYDGQTASGGNHGYATDLAGVQLDGSLSYGTTSKNAGTYRASDATLLFSGLYSGQQGYDIVYADAALTIAKANLILSGLGAASKTYDSTDAATLTGTATVTALGSDTVILGGSGRGHFADKNAGTGKLVSVTGYTLSGADAGNYELVTPSSLTASIAKANLALSGITAANKTYDGTMIATVTGTASVTAFGSDAVSVTGSGSGRFADKNVGIGKTVSISGYSLIGADAGNYDLVVPSSLTASIAKASLVVSGIGAANKTYDGTHVATLTGIASVTGFGGDVLSLSGTGMGRFADKNAGIAKTVSFTGYTLSGTDAANYDLMTPSNLTADITKANLILSGLSAAGKTYDGTTGATLSGAASVTAFGNDIIVITGAGTGRFADKNVGTGKAVSVSGYSLSGADAGNYDLIVPTGLTADIAKANVVLSGISAANKTYDGTAAATLTGTASVTAFGSDVVAVGGAGTGRFADKNVGTGKTVSVSGYSLVGADAGNYDLVMPSNLTADIAKASLILSGLTTAGKTYDGTNAASLSGVASVTGFGNDIVAVGGIGTGRFADKNAGTAKAVSVSGYSLVGADAGNYDLATPSNLTADIAKANLVLNGLGAANKTYDGTDVATLTGIASVTGIGGDVLSLSGTGVGRFDDKNARAGKAVSVTGYTLSGADAGNYSLVPPTGLTADIAQRVLTISGTHAADKIYDGNTMAETIAGTLSGLVGGETLGVSATGRFDTVNAGQRTVTATYTLADTAKGSAGNYILADTTGHLATITPGALSVIANDDRKLADGQAYTGGNGVTYAGFVNGEGTAVLGGRLVYGGTAQGALAPGNYAIAVSGLTAANYDLSYVDGRLTIAAPEASATGAPSAGEIDRSVRQEAQAWMGHLGAAEGTARWPSVSSGVPLVVARDYIRLDN